MTSPLLALAWRFGLISIIAFGGPSAVLPETQRLFVGDGHFLTAERFAALFSIAQISPGPNTMYATLIGWQVGGIAGALVSTLLMYGPSSVLAWSVEHFTGRHHSAVWMVTLRRALAPITIALLVSSGYILSRSVDHNIRAVILTLATVIVGVRTRINFLWLIAIGAALGVMGFV